MPPQNPGVPQAPETSPAPEPQVPSNSRMKANFDLLEPGEEMITVIYRHVIGLILIYLEALVAVVAILALIIVLEPGFFSDVSSDAYVFFFAGATFAIALLVFVLLIATYVYRQNRLIITNKTLIEVLQVTLFIRKVSRLSLTNVEDVSADQRGILPNLFNYGTLMVQTAGAMDNFIFKYCPDPNRFARRILEAREAYAENLNDEGRRLDSAAAPVKNT